MIYGVQFINHPTHCQRFQSLALAEAWAKHYKPGDSITQNIYELDDGWRYPGPGELKRRAKAGGVTADSVLARLVVDSGRRVTG